MALKITKTDVWAVEIQDQPGGLAKVMEVIAEAGANLECVIARRQADKPGTGVAFVTPLKGRKVAAAAATVGFHATKRVATLKVEGTDRPGMGARLVRALAKAGINLRGVSGATLGRNFVVYLGFDSAADARKAAGVVRNFGRKR